MSDSDFTSGDPWGLDDFETTDEPDVPDAAPAPTPELPAELADLPTLAGTPPPPPPPVPADDLAADSNPDESGVGDVIPKSEPSETAETVAEADIEDPATGLDLGDFGDFGDFADLTSDADIDSVDVSVETIAADLSDLGDLGDLAELGDLGDLGDLADTTNFINPDADAAADALAGSDLDFSALVGDDPTDLSDLIETSAFEDADSATDVVSDTLDAVGTDNVADADLNVTTTPQQPVSPMLAASGLFGNSPALPPLDEEPAATIPDAGDDDEVPAPESADQVDADASLDQPPMDDQTAEDSQPNLSDSLEATLATGITGNDLAEASEPVATSAENAPIEFTEGDVDFGSIDFTSTDEATVITDDLEDHLDVPMVGSDDLTAAFGSIANLSDDVESVEPPEVDFDLQSSTPPAIFKELENLGVDSEVDGQTGEVAAEIPSDAPAMELDNLGGDDEDIDEDEDEDAPVFGAVFGESAVTEDPFGVVFNTSDSDDAIAAVAAAAAELDQESEPVVMMADPTVDDLPDFLIDDNPADTDSVDALVGELADSSTEGLDVGAAISFGNESETALDEITVEDMLEAPSLVDDESVAADVIPEGAVELDAVELDDAELEGVDLDEDVPDSDLDATPDAPIEAEAADIVAGSDLEFGAPQVPTIAADPFGLAEAETAVTPEADASSVKVDSSELDDLPSFASPDSAEPTANEPIAESDHDNTSFEPLVAGAAVVAAGAAALGSTDASEPPAEATTEDEPAPPPVPTDVQIATATTPPPTLASAPADIDYQQALAANAQGWVADSDGVETFRIIVTNLSTVEGYAIDVFMGLAVTDSMVSSRDVSAIAAARQAAIETLISDARNRGAHAVIGVNHSAQAVDDGMIVTVSGTAVSLRPLED